MNYLGIDIGSSGCKALVVDGNGQQLAIAQREYNVYYSGEGSATLDSNEVIEKCFEVIKECSNHIKPSIITGIGISSQGEAFTAIGDNNETLCDAMVSSDISSESFIKDWTSSFGKEKLYKITGHTAHPMFTLFKLLWFKNNKPELWDRTRYFLCFEDLLQFKLGLTPAISWSLAGRTMMFDVRKHEWDKNILKEIGIPAEKLATPLPAGSRVGTINNKTANQLGLSENVFVVTGGHDQTCSALGAGVIDEGDAMLATGTVECICPVFKTPVFSKILRDSNLCTYNYSIKELYATVAYSLTGGNIFKWYRDQFGQQEIEEAKRIGKDVYELLIHDIDNNPGKLMALPYFTPSGTPYFDTHTKGAIIGLSMLTQRKDILKALLEGVSFEMRLNLDILESAGYKINELRWTGGGSKSKFLAQLKANVMNKKIVMLNINEAGCFGAAMLACSADTGESIRDLTSRWVKKLTVIDPQPGNEKWYSDRFETYKKLYKNVKELSI
ncbi:MAG: FGGY-family carbohydrate kinase [Ignavibacteriaceae bacterium]